MEVVAPVTGPPPAAGFSLAHFQMSPEGLVLACPQGEARYRPPFSVSPLYYREVV